MTTDVDYGWTADASEAGAARARAAAEHDRARAEAARAETERLLAEADLTAVRRRAELDAIAHEYAVREALGPAIAPAVGPDGPPPDETEADADPEVRRMAADLRTEADGPGDWPPSAKAVRSRFGIGHDRAVRVLNELARSGP